MRSGAFADRCVTNCVSDRAPSVRHGQHAQLLLGLRELHAAGSQPPPLQHGEDLEYL